MRRPLVLLAFVLLAVGLAFRAVGASSLADLVARLAPAAKVTVAKLRMELCNISSIKWFDGMGEYVIDWGPGYRIYLAKDGDKLIVLFGGGTKRGQQRDIDKAKELLAEYKARKKEILSNITSKHKGKLNGLD